LRALDNGRAAFFISFLMTPRTRFSSQLLRRAARRDSRGFTLLEILLAVAILGMLVALAITNVDRIFGTSQEDAARLFVTQSLQVPLQSYRTHMGNYPTAAEGLQALITAPADKADRWRGPYITGETIPLDPWKNAYQYRFPGVRNRTGYDVWSKGPDGQDGTADDIGNWSSASAPGTAAP
jgi:general secretion pathway protein G